jgi:hypothetical protein
MNTNKFLGIQLGKVRLEVSQIKKEASLAEKEKREVYEKYGLSENK